MRENWKKSIHVQHVYQALHNFEESRPTLTYKPLLQGNVKLMSIVGVSKGAS